MALICDTGGVYALYDADDRYHQATRKVVETEPGPLLVPVVLLAEIDYLLTVRLGTDAALDFLESVQLGAFTIVALADEDLTRCRELMKSYQAFPLGVADASVIAAAERLGLRRILTTDERHFRAIRPRGLDHLILLPADQG